MGPAREAVLVLPAIAVNKKFIYLSLAVNLGFTVWLILTGFFPRAQSRLTMVSSDTLIPAAGSFSWSQIQSEDYPTFIANLRGIGCPEKTILAIIQKELDDSFAVRRAPLLERVKIVNATEEDRRHAEAALRALWEEENHILDEMFGTRSRPATARADILGTVRAMRTTSPVIENTKPTMPLVFQSLNTNQFGLGAEDPEVIERVRQDFLVQLGTNQDVSSLEYLQSWQKAQKQADALLDAMLGRQAWLQYQQAAQSPAPEGQ